MAVAVDASWKLAIGYFFIVHLGSEEKSQIIRLAVQKLHDIKVEAISVTCDCPSPNWAALKRLGAVFGAENAKPWFTHPSDNSSLVNVILDPCHLIKLVRNTLSDLGVLYDGNGKAIRYGKCSKFSGRC